MLERVLLINPNYSYFPGLLERKVNYRQPSLGLAYLAGSIRKRCLVEVKICDAALLEFTEKQVVEYAKTYNPHFVGISVHTLTVGFARKVALGIRHLFPEAMIVFGGPHVTALPFENLDVADVCVTGEGEHTFVELLNCFLKGDSCVSVEGIAIKQNGTFFKTKERELIANLDELPLPARDLLPPYTFRHIYPYRLETPYYSTIITSRGCSFDCAFCSNEVMWKKKVRYRSIDNTLIEIEELVKRHAISLLFIHDDNFTGNQKRVFEFCKEKQKHFPALKWICHARADCLTFDLLREMKTAGCVEIQIGVESGDDKVLRVCKKGFQTALMRKTFQFLKRTKINSWATFIIGNEADTVMSIERTIRFAKEIDPTYCSFLFLIPLPGTQLFEHFVEKGYIKTFEWSQYNFHAAPVFETEHLSIDALLNLRKKAYRNFYLRPEIIYRYLKAMFVSNQWKIIFSDSFILMKFLLGLIVKRKGLKKNNILQPE